MSWTQEEAVMLARQVELIAPRFNCHVALTGGCLYKFGPRKDLDLLFYRVRAAKTIERDALLAELHDVLGLEIGERKGWVRKAKAGDKDIDLFFPELPAEWDREPSDSDVYNFRGVA